MKLSFFILNFMIINLFGILNHFLYDLLGKKKLLKIFFATNESTFEHMKLVLYPSMLSVFLSKIIFDYKGIIFASSLGIIITIILIPMLYYCCKFVLKKDIAFINILIFIISVLVGTIVNCCLVNYSYNYLGVILFIFLVCLFTYFSFKPGKSILFYNPKN